MHDLYNKLSQILKLEQQKNFNDSVVIGGLEGFLAFWLADAGVKARDSLNRRKVEEVRQRLHGYTNMATEERRMHVLYLIERISAADAAPLNESATNPATRERSTLAGRGDWSTREPGAVERRGVVMVQQPPTDGDAVLPREDQAAGAAKICSRDEPVKGSHVIRERSVPASSPPSRSASFGRHVAQPASKKDSTSPQQSDTVAPPYKQKKPRLAASARPSVPEARLHGPRSQSRVPTRQPMPPVTAKPPRSEAENRKINPAPGTLSQPSWAPSASKRVAPSRRSLQPEVALKLEGELDSPVTSLPRVGKTTAKKLEKLNIRTIRDLLYHVPFRYEDYTTMKPIVELRYGDEITIVGVVQKIDMYKSKRGIVVVNCIIGDGTGTLRVKWFGNRYIVNHLRRGTMVRLSGKVDAYMGHLQMASPRFEVVTEAEVRNPLLIPVYSRTEGLSEKALTNYIDMALKQYAGRIPDPLPNEICDHYELIHLSQAIRWLHKASSIEQVRAAQKRLAFDELLRLQLGMLQQRAAWQSQPGNTIQADEAVIARFYASLPFELTNAQTRCVSEILADMSKSYAMSRLLQGDVGSGKTAVAATALLAAVSAGFQGALMAPTEILAEQHFAGVSKFLNPEGTHFLGDRPIRLALLTGSLSARQRRETREAIANGEVDVIIGTHALIQEDISYPKLGLAIVDEQHRFGVKQRGALRKRTFNGTTPDLLVMSATPIPRSLALTLYGDLELSIIDEMPPGRQTIVTRAITPELRERAYTYIRRQIQTGRQAFIICPLVEESDKVNARAAVDEHAFLQKEVFPEYSVELLHGRLKPSEKEAAMARFYRNESQILVSTSVVEVGIDVPNANVMLIEGANRFGLAQLHQFRGRIGRGKWRSLCLLMAEEDISEEALQRLQVLVENSDGFALAEEDLKMRGAGDFFGTRQSGMVELKMAKLGDTITLSKAREVAKQILYHDSELKHPAHQLLKVQTEKHWNKEADGVS